VFRYADVHASLYDRRLGRGETTFRPGIDPEDLERLDLFWEKPTSLVMVDPPHHSRLRSLIFRAFTPRRVEEMRPRITQIADRLLDRLTEGDIRDWMNEVAFDLPIAVIGELLGVPEEDRAQFLPLAKAAHPALDPWATLEQVTKAHEASLAMTSYFDDLLAERKKHPDDGLLSAMVKAEEDGDKLSHEELITMSALLFVGGFGTSANLMGNGLYGLLRHPDQLRRLQNDHSLVPSAVEEFLRWDSPVQINARMVLEPVVIGEQPLEAGTFILLLPGAANRDPAQFTNPDDLDIGRDEGQPLSFGAGAHYCIGAALTRLQAQVLFKRFLERFSSVELCGDAPQRHDTFTMRGVLELPIRVRTRS
jgi:cytochrome P450